MVQAIAIVKHRVGTVPAQHRSLVAGRDLIILRARSPTALAGTSPSVRDSRRLN